MASYKPFSILVRIVFGPAIVLMSRLSHLAQFILIGSVLTPTLAFVLHLQYADASEKIRFYVKESAGIAYITLLRDFLHELERRRVLLAGIRAGEPMFEEALERSAVDPDALVEKINTLDTLHGKMLNTTTRWTELRLSWTKQRDSPALNTGGIDRQPGEMTTKVFDLIRYVGDTSNLILDPDLDSYWLMHAFVIDCPAVGETVTGNATLVLNAPANAAGTSEWLLSLAGGLQTALSTTSALINVDLKTALAATSKFGKSTTMANALAGPMKRLEEAVNVHAEIIKRRVLPGQPAALSRPVIRTVVNQTLETLQRNYELHAASGPELDKLVRLRLGLSERSRIAGVTAVIAALLALLYLLVGFYLALRRAATEKKRAEQEYQAVIETSLDGFWLVGAQGHLLAVNDAASEMLGYRRDELLAMTVNDIEAREYPEDLARGRMTILDTQSGHFETRHRRKDGSYVDVDVATKDLPHPSD